MTRDSRLTEARCKDVQRRYCTAWQAQVMTLGDQRSGQERKRTVGLDRPVYFSSCESARATCAAVSTFYTSDRRTSISGLRPSCASAPY